MKVPLISICIPVYNGAQYLESCIQSVIQQTFSDWEIIITDDQSTDDSLKIAQEYAYKDSRIRVISNPTNLGMAENWNYCAAQAKGIWIKFLFQDDELTSTCMEYIVPHLSDNIMIAITDRKYIYSEDVVSTIRSLYENDVIKLKNHLNIKQPIYISSKDISELLSGFQNRNFLGEPSCVLIRKQWFDTHPPFDTSFVQLCDYEYWIRSGTESGILYIPEELVKFRVHNRSMSSVNRNDGMDICDTVLLLHKILHSREFASFRTNSGIIQQYKIKLTLNIRIYELQLLLSNNNSPRLRKKYQEISHLITSLNNLPSLITRILFYFILLKRRLTVNTKFAE